MAQDTPLPRMLYVQTERGQRAPDVWGYCRCTPDPSIHVVRPKRLPTYDDVFPDKRTSQTRFPKDAVRNSIKGASHGRSWSYLLLCRETYAVTFVVPHHDSTYLIG